jgi:TonB-linked SusC/RagA family outer membrane protein
MEMTVHVKKWSLPYYRASKAFFLLLVSIFMSNAVFSQSISMNLKNASLEKVFRVVESKIEQRFSYTKEMLEGSHPVTINVQNASLQKVLDLIFEGQPLEYALEEGFIKVRYRTVPLPQKGISLQGQVVSDNGEPLIGTTIIVKGTNQLTISDNEGRFYFKDIDKDAVLVVTNVGYTSKEIAVNSRSNLNIQLSAAITPLDESIIIAYGTTTRRFNTGTVSRVSSAEIEKQPVSNPLAAMEGRMAGVVVTQESGLPGSNFSVLIRGRNSIQNGTSPLYIIDGVPFLSDNDRLTQRSQINANSPFNTLNPADIQSIEVLKDADATAIYGSRGANGVILITTKKGNSGKTGVDFNFYTGWAKASYDLDFMNTPQYLAMRREAFQNDGVTPTVSNAPDLLRWDTTRFVNWKQLLIGGTSRTTNMQGRLYGGSRGTMFSFGANYYKETTVFPGDANLSKKAVDLSVTHHSQDNHFTATIQTSYGSNDSKLYQQDLTQYLNTIPNAPYPYDSLGHFNWSENGAQYTNPLANILKTYNVVTDRLTSNANLSYKLSNFNFKVNAGYNLISVAETIASPIIAQNPALSPKGSAGFANSNSKIWIVEPQVSYKSSIGKKGSYDLLVGGSWQQNLSNQTDTRASGYTNDDLLGSTAGAATITSTTYTGFYYRYNSFFGRASFNWDKRYLLNLTFRRDGSSRFGPDNRFGNFGAIGAGWVFVEEKYPSAKKQSFLSFGKLRGSYGITGNDQIGDYQYLDTWSATTFPYGGTSGLLPTRITNPDFGWEQKRNLELALDLGFFSNKILLTANYYRSRSDNQIIRYTLPDQTGSNNILRNFPGKVQNEGLEIEASTSFLLKKDFNWKTGFNISFPKNKLISFPGLAQSSYATTYVEGQPLNVLRGYSFLGVDPNTGVYKFEDVNRDGLINSLDYVVIGNTNPKYYGGLQNSFTWKRLELQGFIQFVEQQGRHIVYGNSQRYGQLNFNHPVLILEHWAKQGDLVPYQKYTQAASTTAGVASGLISSSSAVLTDASYIRLKNVSFSYLLPAVWLNRMKMERARVYFEAQNLLTLTKYKGPDPENQSRLVLPPLRMIAAGIQLTF